MDTKKNQTLSFLDVLISFNKDEFTTSIHIKKTSTLFGTNYFSFSPYQFILSGLRSKVFRNFRISSTWIGFHTNMEYLLKFSDFNLFPRNLSFKLIHDFLDNIFQPKQPVPNVPKQKIYLRLSYIGNNTYKLIDVLIPMLNRAFTSSQFIFGPINNFKTSSFFAFKDRIPCMLRSSLVYSYNCADCNIWLVGQTGLQLKLRISKHAGLSYRKGRPLSSPEDSAIRKHTEESQHGFSADGFKSLTTASNSLFRQEDFRKFVY